MTKFFARFFATAPGSTNNVQRFILSTVASLYDSGWIKVIQWYVPSKFDVNFSILDRGPDVEEVEFGAWTVNIRYRAWFW